MTLFTSMFKALRHRGVILKHGKARFYSGMRAYERTLWKDRITGEEFIVLDREAHPFTRYKWREQEGDPGFDGYIYGRI